MKQDGNEPLVEMLFRNGTSTVVGIVPSFFTYVRYAVGTQSDTLGTERSPCLAPPMVRALSRKLTLL